MRGALLAAVVLLAGCATQTSRTAMAPDVLRLQSIAGFQLEGRIGVSTARDGFNADLSWRQLDDDVLLAVRGPMGIGRVEVAGNADGVEVRSADGSVVTLADPSSAFLELYGLDLPLASLRYWAVGVPRPGSPGARLVRADGTAAGRIDALEQDGWQVRYDQYRDFDGWVLPRKLELTSPEVRVRLVIRDWRIDEGD